MSEETTNKTLVVMAENTKDIDVTSRATPDIEIEKDQNAKTNSSNASEYDSAETYSDRENGSVSGTESEGSVIFEREEGDGQESTPAKKVDDDEDKKNPQYIPKRGTFYEHDDRTADDIESPEADKTDKDGKKKVWQDKKERWSHDRFNDNEQAPKSKAELVAIYGYDIRNEDGPPRARRRRRYGRGPNKYTRNWEDVEAYGKPTVIRKTTKKRSPRGRGNDKEEEEEEDQESIKELQVTESGRNEMADKNEREEKEVEKEQRIPPNSNEQNKQTNHSQSQHHHQQSHQHHDQQHQKQYQKDTTFRQNISSSHPNDNKQQYNKGQQRAGTGRITKPKREITDSDYRGFTKSRQFKSSPSTKIHGRNNYNSNHGGSKNSVQELERDVGKMSMQEGGGGAGFKSNQKHNNQRQGSMPPRLQAEQKGSKRYSSIRQRSLPETANPPFVQHTNYYGNEFGNQQNQTSQPQPTIINNTIQHPPTAQMPPPQIPTQTLPPIAAQVPVTTTPILQAPPPQFAPPFTPAPPFLQPGVPPASFIPPQTAPILNYVQGQPQYPQPPYQGFQQPFNAVNQPAELFQPQGGITYYSTQEQQAAQRAAPPKRPKAAIPIVAPPEHRGRGRSTNQQALAEPLNTAIEPIDNNNPTTIVNPIDTQDAAKFEDVLETAAQ